MKTAAKVFKMDRRDGRSQGWFDPPNRGPYDYQGVKPATAAIILTIGKRLLRGWLNGLNWMGCGAGIGMRVDRAGGLECGWTGRGDGDAGLMILWHHFFFFIEKRV